MARHQRNGVPRKLADKLESEERVAYYQLHGRRIPP
jgi:hypothetical protein